MNDLVERLREYSLSPTVQAEAADEIERLQARVAEFEQYACGVRCPNCDNLRLELGSQRARVAELEDALLHESISPCPECERLHTRCAELEAQVAEYENVIIPSWKREEEMWREDEANAIEDRRVLSDEIERLRERLAEAERDAARYRWLRGDSGPQSVRWSRWSVQHWTGSFWDTVQSTGMDVAIDAAMFAEQQISHSTEDSAAHREELAP